MARHFLAEGSSSQHPVGYQGEVGNVGREQGTGPSVMQEVDNMNWATPREEILSPGVVIHFPGNPQPLNVDEYEETDRTLDGAFPGTRHSIDELIAEGDLVAFRYVARCVHKGEFQGAAPTGKAVNLTAIGMARVADGKIVEAWIEADMLGFMMQIGAIPAAPQATS